jgi:RNA polymerase sigma-70 factor (ECF subfamily)
VDRAQTAAVEFEMYRPRLTGVAYRMPGTLADAEDAVQETYLRFARANRAGVRDVPGWLITTVARICLDELGSARARRERYVGPWLPEPVVGAGSLAAVALGPEDRVTLDESVSMAMLVLLESLSPAERTAFILRDVMGLGYAEVARTVGRTEPACRQLVARARARVRGSRDEAGVKRFAVDPGRHAVAVRSFLAACAGGRVDDLLRVLDPAVVLRSDGGGRVRGVALRPVAGADRVARLLIAIAARGGAGLAVRSVNGGPGLVVESGGRIVGVMGFAVAEGLITEIDFVLNPEKLRRVTP